MRDFSKLESLRKRAEELVGSDRIISDPSLEQVDDLVHELNVYRGELELQSSDLLDAHVALERSLATWRNFFDESSSFFIILDGNHCVRAINRAALEFLRLDISRIEGQPVYGLFPAPRRPEVKVFLSRIFNNMLRNEQHLTIRCFVEDDLVETQLQARCIGRDEELARRGLRRRRGGNPFQVLYRAGGRSPPSRSGPEPSKARRVVFLHAARHRDIGLETHLDRRK